MAVITRLTDGFTNPEGLPIMLHGVGVDGSIGRWLMSDVSVDNNNVFKTVTSHPAGQPIASPDTDDTKWPTLRTVSGIKVAEFDGNDALLGGFFAETPLTPYRTVAMVVRRTVVTGDPQIVLGGGSPTAYAVGTDASNNVSFIWLGSTAGGGAPWADTLWHFLAWSGSATDQVGVFDGNVYNATGDIASAASQLWLGSAGFAPVYGKFEIAEVITWPTALSSGNLALVRAAMQDRYGEALGL